MGSRLRLQAAAERHLSGQPLTITFVGGSITGGTGTVKSRSYVEWAERIFQKLLAKDGVLVHNGAASATSSSFMSVCHHRYVHNESDIIFVEYAINEPEAYREKAVPMNNMYRRYFERLLRQLLKYPKQPAVVLFNAYAWFRTMDKDGDLEGHTHGSYWKTNDRDFFEIASYYELPVLSMRSCCYHLMRTGAPHFSVATHWSALNASALTTEEILAHKHELFFFDLAHPFNVGHRIMGEVAAQFVMDGIETARHKPLTPQQTRLLQDAAPPPMLPGNYESHSDRCLLGDGLLGAVQSSPGWTWVNEGKPGQQDKWGMISTQPGSTMRLGIDTTSVLNDAAPAVQEASSGVAAAAATVRQAGKIRLIVAYLKSYEHMGRASVACEDGCSCEPSILEGHSAKSHTSQLFLHELEATQSPNCTLAITVLQDSGSGEHKVKVAGLMVNEEVTSHQVIANGRHVAGQHSGVLKALGVPGK